MRELLGKRISFEKLFRLKMHLEEKCDLVESPRLIPTRSISSCGLTVIDYENSLRRKIDRTLSEGCGITNEAILIMH